MKQLLEFIQKINKDMGILLPSNWHKLSDIEIAQRFIGGINRYFFQTYRGIEKTIFQGEEFQYFSEFHRFWEANHEIILNANINCEQVQKAARSLSQAIKNYGIEILNVKQETLGLHTQAVAQVRFFTANQDFREPPKNSFKKYLEDPSRFVAKEIANDPADFLRFLGMTRLSQTDKRLDFAKNAAEFLLAYDITAFELARRFNNDARQIRSVLISTSNMGYGLKKANMFIRDMVELGVWNNLSHFEDIDVASDINVMKLALRTRIVETAMPLISSFLDFFCHQYEYINKISAQAWRFVWENWQYLPEKNSPRSPCLMDSLLYRIGRDYCKDNLIRYKCSFGHEFYYFGARLKKCRLCRNTVEVLDNLLPCQVNTKELPREADILMLSDENLFRIFDGKCILENVCLPKSESFRMFNPPKSISIKGQTGWTSAYAYRERGGGGLMS